MPLGGSAFLALWNDVARSREAEYDRWHTFEHVPERVAVDGFHGARRYVNRSRETHRYFTLYDVSSTTVFGGAEYRDLVERPTPWSASMRVDFANVVRAACDVVASEGTGIGAAIACLCIPPTIHDRTLRDATELALAAPRINAAHVGRRVEDAGGAWTAPGAHREFDRIALIEALDREAATHALAQSLAALGLDGLPRDFGADVYDLALAFPAAGAAERIHHRRREWT